MTSQKIEGLVLIVENFEKMLQVDCEINEDSWSTCSTVQNIPCQFDKDNYKFVFNALFIGY